MVPQVVRFEIRSRLFRFSERKRSFPLRTGKLLLKSICFRLRFSEKAFSFWASLLSFMLLCPGQLVFEAKKVLDR